jgi:hypothetical protein
MHAWKSSCQRNKLRKKAVKRRSLQVCIVSMAENLARTPARYDTKSITQVEFKKVRNLVSEFKKKNQTKMILKL